MQRHFVSLGHLSIYTKNYCDAEIIRGPRLNEDQTQSTYFWSNFEQLSSKVHRRSPTRQSELLESSVDALSHFEYFFPRWFDQSFSNTTWNTKTRVFCVRGRLKGFQSRTFALISEKSSLCSVYLRGSVEPLPEKMSTWRKQLFWSSACMTVQSSRLLCFELCFGTKHIPLSFVCSYQHEDAFHW